MARRRRTAAVLLSLAGLGSTAVFTTTASVDAATAPKKDPLRAAAAHYVKVSGLDNPRQLSLSRGRLVVAEAGSGDPSGTHCISDPDAGEQCVGNTGRVSVVAGNHTRSLMRGLLSAAGPDGSFAVGSDGAGRQGGRTYAIVTYAPPDVIPSGVPGRQAGKLLVKRPGGKVRILADVSRFERRNDVDGEGVDSNPYSLLPLGRRILVADAAGDYIAQVKRGSGKVSVWAKMPEYGKDVDAVPTVVSKGADGRVYVGELHSEQPDQAKVHRFTRTGKHLRAWKGFTTVTGVAYDGRGRLYVSELFGGDCGFEQIPTCFPGRVVRVNPDGTRRAVDVPFPAGIVVRRGVPYVVAFSVSPAGGFGGNPDWSGQIWRLRNF